MTASAQELQERIANQRKRIQQLEQSNIDLRKNAERGFAHESHEITAKIHALENGRQQVVEQLRLCRRRVTQLEHGIARYLEAHDASEMSNEQAAIEHLRHLQEQE